MGNGVDIPFSAIGSAGTATLLIGLVLAAWAISAGIAGTLRKSSQLVASAVYTTYGFAALMTLSSALMIYGFVTHDYSIKYIASTSDTSMYVWYKFTAYWGALEGSMLFWVFVLSVFAAVAVWRNHKRHRDMIGYIVATIMVAQLFFLAILVFAKNPFLTTLTTPPNDGEGLNPLLQNYWMVIHPPVMYIGYIASTIPFAFAIGALASGRLDDSWLRSVRSWMLICFFFLSFGLILGGRWAYEELGWGGYWAWDPVENAGFLPWWTATAFLHSIIVQEQRGMFKRWNLILAVLTFLLTMLGTFMTRAGIVQSVHAFGKDNQLATYFLVFLLFTMIISFGLIFYRSHRLRTINSFDSLASRDAAFLLNNWILLVAVTFIVYATFYPTITEHFGLGRRTIQPSFFNLWMTPIGLVLVFLAGAGPLLAWKKTTPARLWQQVRIPLAASAFVLVVLPIVSSTVRTSTAIFIDDIRFPVGLVNFTLVTFTIFSVLQEFVKGVRARHKQTGSRAGSLIWLLLKKQRKYGGYVVHLGIAVMFIGFAGKAYELQVDKTVTQKGETFTIRDYQFTYKDVELLDTPGYTATKATLEVAWGNTRKLLTPSKRRYKKGDQETTEVDFKLRFKSGGLEDIYVAFSGADISGGQVHAVNFRVFVNPLLNWVWIGFGIFSLGCLICLFPGHLVKLHAGGATAAAIAVVLLAGNARAQEHQASPLPPPRAQGHQVSEGVAHRCQPDSSEAKQELGEYLNQEDTKQIVNKIFLDTVCLCGGCTRESLRECRCGFAAKERCDLLPMIRRELDNGTRGKDLYTTVVAQYVEMHGEHATGKPRSGIAKAVPFLILLASGGGIFLLGRYFRTRKTTESSEEKSEVAVPEDDPMLERLEDELEDFD